MASTSRSWGCCADNNYCKETELINCTRCNKSFHFKCLSIPGIPADSEAYRKWKCSGCITNTSTTEGTPNRNVSTTRGNKRPALNSPPQASPVTADDVRAIVKEVMKVEFATMLQQINNTILSVVNKELEPVKHEIRELSTSLNFHTKLFEEYQSEHVTLKNTVKELKLENTQLKSSYSELCQRINYLEQQARSNNLEIQCFPENKQENLYTVVKQLGSVVNCELKDSDILHCTRTAKLQTDSPRPRSVVVQLASPRIRDQLLAAVIDYNKSNKNNKLNSADFGLAGMKSPIYVVEHLSSSNKSLHAAARLKAKEKGYKRSSAGLLAPQLACQSSSPAASAPAPPLPAPASPPRIVSAPPAPTQPPPDPAPQDQEDGVRLRRTHTVAVRDYLKRETQTFFGVQRDNEREQRRLWYERRRRHAARALGDLRPDLPPDHHPDDDDISMYGASGAAPREARGRARERPDVLPAPAPLEDPAPPSLPHPGKDSVARLTFTGLSYVVAAVTRRSRQSTSAQWSRSFRGGVPPHEDVDVDDVFFTPPTSATPLQHHDDAENVDGSKGPRSPIGSSSVEYRRPERSVSWGAGGARIHTPMLEPLADNSNRRQFGMGVVGRFFRRSLRKSVTHHEEVARQLDELTDYRPYFTWWVSTVQTLVLLLSLLCYGFGPVGFGRHTHSGQVLVKSLSLQQVEWEEPASFWLGPRAADLIHLGAKFAPCMRRDARIARAIAASARRERDTACCIRNDDSGCVQSSKADCSSTISTWKKWSSGESGPGGRISGSVCGLDPKFCEAPRSIAPHEWPDDITKWPICRKSVLDGSAAAGRAGHAAEHMACEVIGHPCCIGVHGQCVITTREHCDFVKGYFHEEASLCSQVSCLDDVCGMLPFMRRRRPDQLYRAWTSLFVHAGLLHLAATLALQWLFMRDLEKMAGPVRIAVIYLGSGVAGNMASAIFEPYRAEVGPAGAHFGLLACLIVEVIGAWPLLRHPKRALLKLVGIAVALFLLGLLPWIDNFAHVFGFVFGFLLAYGLLPFITFGPYERRRKIALVWVCMVSAGGMLCALVALFYAAPAYECAACAYFTCLPFAPDMCASQDVRVRQLDGV